MPISDPLRSLQIAAKVASQHVDPDDRAVRVVVFGRSGKLLDLVVPLGLADAPAREPEPVAGWSFEGARAFYDGKPVAVSGSRVKLLRVLVDAPEPLTAKELAKRAFGDHADEESARFHVRELRKELKSHFELDGDVIVNEGSGYRLTLR